MKKANFLSILLVFLMNSSLYVYAQNWNLVWREDFGVVSDSSRMDFADPLHTMPGHICQTDLSQSVQDGSYAIVNSTAWAFPKDPSQTFFKMGRDHTGNKDGAMLVVNTDGRMVGEVIYEQTIDFALCTANKYRFSMYAASITAFECIQASLEILILGDGTTELARKKTGDIPWWEAVSEAEKYSDNPFTVREWTKYDVEFNSEGYQSITIQIINLAKCTKDGKDPSELQEWEGCEAGNDFALDDLSLYRNDIEDVPETEVSATTISSQAKLDANCIYSSSYSIPLATLEKWKSIYPSVYFLWQESENGYEWRNMMDKSGVDKIEMETEADATKTLRYRVIITGGMTEAEGETVALQIAKNGGPDDGCYKYAISNTLAAAKMQADCSYNKMLKKIWREDFGVIDSFSIKGYDGMSANMKLFDVTTENEFGIGYVVASAADTAVHSASPTHWNPYPERICKGLAQRPNDAYLYMHLDKTSASEAQNLLLDKAISGPFCNCKSFFFSFLACNLNEWGGVLKIKARILNSEGAILGEESFAIRGTGSKSWVRNTVAFDVEKNYKNGIHVQLINDSVGQYERLAIDDLEVAVCGDILPDATIGIDNTTRRYLSGFDCSETPFHTFGALSSDEWKYQFPNFGCAWQYSTDGGATWQFYQTGLSLEYNNGENGLMEYRAVFAETEEVAKEIAQSGKVPDPCNAYVFSNVIGFDCKQTGCRAPLFQIEDRDTIEICSDQTDPIAISVVKKNTVNVDEMRWFTSPAGKNQWNLVEEWKTAEITVSPAESTDYLFIARNDTCYSDSLFARINVHQAITLEPIKDTTLCINSSLTLEAKAQTGVPNSYLWNETKQESNQFTLSNLKEAATITLSATDGVCTSQTMSVSVEVEDSVHAALSIDKTDVCMGDEVTLTLQTSDSETHQFSLVKSEYGTLTKLNLANTYTEEPQNESTYTLKGTAKYCPSVESSVSVTVNEIPSAPNGTLRVDYLMDDAENGSFKSLLAQNPNAVAIEGGYTYTWYDSEENIIGSTAPTIEVPAEGNTDDISYSYFIDRASAQGCVSQKSKVVVNVFSAPAPLTHDLDYCLGEDASPLTAEVSTTEGTTAGDFDLLWYTSKEGASALSEAPTPNTAEAGVVTYYVSQKHKVTNAESGRVPLTITTHKVEKVLLGENKTSYCKEETPQVLVATTADAQNSLVWTLNNEKISANSINTFVNATTTYTYKVYQTLAIGEGHICTGQEDSVKITVTCVREPMGTYTVSYTRMEAENNGGRFANNLSLQNEEVAKADDSHTLLWYDEDMNLIGEVAPTPDYDPSWENGKDIELTYYVAQQEINSLCMSAVKKVTVFINDAPTPTVSELHYCLNGKPNARDFKEDLRSAASVNVIPGGEPASHYRLVWFTSATEYLTNPSAGTNEPQVLPNTEQEGVQSFYVCQMNTLTEAISSPSIVKVTIHPLPTISTQEIPVVCSYDGEEVVFDLNDGLNHTNDPIAYTADFFANSALSESSESIVKKAGSYYVRGYYSPVEGTTCYSEPQKITVEIAELSTPIISADATVCPNSSVTLSATATTNLDELIQYSWTCNKDNVISANNNYQITTNPLSSELGDSYQFTVTATAGICQKSSDIHTVTVGNAPLEGSITITEKGKAEPIGVVTQSIGNEFYSCGEELTFTTDFKKSTGEYIWSNGQVGASIVETVLDGDKTYKLTFTNECPATVEFTIHAVPVSLRGAPENFNGCEGESLVRTLDVNCLESNYTITWNKPDGTQIVENGEEARTLSIASVAMSDNGQFEYEVVNRACSIKGAFEAKVMQTVKFDAPELTILERGRDTTLRINFTEHQPALIEWKENEASIGAGNEYTLRDIRGDHTYEVIMNDPDYCETKAQLEVWVDASLVMNTSLKDSICADEQVTLVIDTMGTGKCRDINKVCKLVIKEDMQGTSKDISNQARLEDGLLKIDLTPSADATYTTTFVYGDAEIEKRNTIIVLQPIQIKSIPNPKVCGDEEVTFEIGVSPDDAIVEWTDDESIKSGLYGTALTVVPSFAGTAGHTEMHDYHFSVNYSFCTPKTGSVSVKVDEPLDYGEIVGDKVICIGNSTNLNASSFEASSYKWSDADSSSSPLLQVRPDTTTTYTVAMSRGECKAQANFKVQVATLPVIESIDSVGVRSRMVKMASGKGEQPFSYQVDNNEASESAFIDNLTFSKHTLFVVDANGCSTEQEFKMTAPSVHFKPFFSPNGDGINDLWDLTSIEELYPKASIKIYDRTGKLIYEGVASDGSWDGTYNGKLMPSADYWYEVYIQEISKMYVGHFTLLRSN